VVEQLGWASLATWKQLSDMLMVEPTRDAPSPVLISPVGFSAAWGPPDGPGWVLPGLNTVFEVSDHRMEIQG
jgi:hypothetical protein